MAKLFISYVREDKKLVDRLVAELREGGVDVWQDWRELRPGHMWASRIRRAIKDGDYFLACFSREYERRGKSYMNEELTLAIEELRQRSASIAWFLPIRLTPCQIPERSIGAGETLRSLHCVDLYEDWDAGVRSLLSVIRERDGTKTSSTQPPAISFDPTSGEARLLDGALIHRVTSLQRCSRNQVLQPTSSHDGGRFYRPYQSAVTCATNVLTCLSEALFQLYSRFIHALVSGQPYRVLRSSLQHECALAVLKTKEINRLFHLDSEAGASRGIPSGLNADSSLPVELFLVLADRLRSEGWRGLVRPSARHSVGTIVTLFGDETSKIIDDSLFSLPLRLALVNENEGRLASGEFVPDTGNVQRINPTTGYYCSAS